MINLFRPFMPYHSNHYFYISHIKFCQIIKFKVLNSCNNYFWNYKQPHTTIIKKKYNKKFVHGETKINSTHGLNFEIK